MENTQFDSAVRVLGASSPRRRLLAGILAVLPAALGIDVATAKKKHCKGKTKLCGDTCISKANCCTNKDCSTGKRCTNGSCRCVPNCRGKQCGSDGCGGMCGSCNNGSCSGGQCICPFGNQCSPGQCCPNEQTCLSGACGACPANPDPCTTEIECGRTTARNPGCYCVTSLDQVTTCTSVFVSDDQTDDCESDEDCVGLFGPGVEAVCVNSPCFFDELGFSKVCVNKGCDDLNALRTRSHADHRTSGSRQLDRRDRR
jgi:hypothetical protein